MKHIKRRTIHLETYGCQMNEYDSELLTTILAQHGYEFVTDEDKADIFLLNTCSVREHANEKIYHRVFDLQKKHKRRKVLIGILGCMAENLQTKLLEDKRFKIDFVAGPDSYRRLPELLQTLELEGKKGYDIELSEIETYENILPARQEGINAWVAIMRGCNNFCTYCVVPYTRGRERSRAAESILMEIEKSVSRGYRQVTLLGQNVNSYSYEGVDFADLLQKICSVEGILRVRYMTSHPKDFSQKLIDTLAGNKKLCKHIHLPLQAGNNRILKMMNRGYTREKFMSLVERIRLAMPDVVLSTDLITGFPTETEEEFNDTLKAVKEIRFDSAFFFKYSEREGTLASRKHKDDVPEDVKVERLKKLVDTQKAISLERNERYIGSLVEVLIDQLGTKRSEEDFQGRMDGNKKVIFPSEGRGYHIGDIIPVKITEATPNILKGIVVLD